MLSYRNALCAFAVTTLLLTITSMEQLRAGELVQFDAVSADAASLRLLGYLARPRGPGAGPFPAVVVLHHCAGFDDLVVSWADRLSSWDTLRSPSIASARAGFRETAPREPIRRWTRRA
jgi:hypothetical protein